MNLLNGLNEGFVREKVSEELQDIECCVCLRASGLHLVGLVSARSADSGVVWDCIHEQVL